MGDKLDPVAATDTAEVIERDLSAVRRLSAVPSILRVICQTTGMGFAAVARVSATTWTACAVHDEINFGLQVGGRLDLATTLCAEVRESRASIVIERASVDPVYASHHTPRIYGIESYVSVPIVLENGEYFGNLCAIDPRPASIAGPGVMSMFKSFAELIGMQLADELRYEQVQAALLDARAAAELREEFIAILGHDLRNPLAAVSASAQILQRREDDPKLVALGRRLGNSTRRMSALIDDVLDFARGRLGQGIGIERTPNDDLGAAIDDVVGELRAAHPNREIVATMKIDCRVECDRGRLQQMVSNLLANALTHGAADRPVSVDAHIDGDALVVSVANAGAPISPMHLLHIFEPYWRGGYGSTRDGLGLGLYICSQIVKAHHGTLSATSTLEDGTRFTARLPIAG